MEKQKCTKKDTEGIEAKHLREARNGKRVNYKTEEQHDDSQWQAKKKIIHHLLFDNRRHYNDDSHFITTVQTTVSSFSSKSSSNNTATKPLSTSESQHRSPLPLHTQIYS